LQYDLSESTTLSIEHGLMGGRNGATPINIVPTGQNGINSQVLLPAAWIHHAHLGIEVRGEPAIRARVHYLTNWTQDDSIQTARDNPTTRALDESYIRDGRITTYGGDASISSSTWGWLGAGVSYTKGENSYPVRGLLTFGGDGESLT